MGRSSELYQQELERDEAVREASAELLDALNMADRLLGQFAGEGWPEWGEAKAIWAAIAAAERR